jgi:hypothetical protein
MAIQGVNYRPHKISPAYNPIVWSFTSDQTFQIDFSYVVDVVIEYAATNSSETIRIKQKANPAGNCVIDISSIVQPYVNLNLYAAETGWTLRYRNSDEIVAWVNLLVGEEYRPSFNSNLEIFNGITNTTPFPPAFYIGSLENDTVPVKVIPAAIPYYTHMANMESTTNYVYWSDYFMDGNGKFLKRDDNTIDVGSNDRHTLTFLNWWEDPTAWNFYSSSRLSVWYIEFNAYDSNGGLISSVPYYNTVAQGGGPQTVTNYTSLTDIRNFNILTFRCGPKDFNITNPLVAYYTLTPYYLRYATFSTSSGVPIVAGETVKFNIVDYCQDLYPKVRFSWLNDLGGRDYWNFTMFYEKTTNSPSEIYSQTNLDWSGTLPVATSGNKTANWLRGGNKVFNKTITTEFTAQSDWLTQPEVEFLSGIPESPSVWVYIGDDDIPYTIEVTDTNYTYKNVKQTKMVQATFKCRLTKIQIKQNL